MIIIDGKEYDIDALSVQEFLRDIEANFHSDDYIFSDGQEGLVVVGGNGQKYGYSLIGIDVLIHELEGFPGSKYDPLKKELILGDKTFKEVEK